MGLRQLLLDWFVSVFSVKNIFIFILIVVFINLYNIWDLPKLIKEKLKVESLVILFILGCGLYAILALVTTLLGSFVIKSGLVISILDAVIIAFMYSLLIRILFDDFNID